MSVQGLMVSVSGIRGRVGEALTPEVVDRYAAAFGAWALARSTSREIVVGRDSRVSGPMFHRVVLAALQSVGATCRSRHGPDADGAARGGAPSRRRRTEHHGEPQPHRVERAQVHRFDRAVPRGGRGDGDARARRAGLRTRQLGQDRCSDLRDDRRDRESRRARARASVLDVESIRGAAFKVALDCVPRRGRDDHAAAARALGCEVESRSTWSRTGAFPRRRSRSPRTSASSRRW